MRTRPDGADPWFARLYRHHAPNVLGLLVRLCDGDRAEAEDLCQETFVAAHQGRATFAGRGSPRAWLLGIAVRRWRDRGRRKSLPTAPDTVQDELPDPSGHDFAEGALTRIALETALRRLEPRHREAILLVVSQRLTYREAAQITGEPIGTVKWRVHEASRQLRSHLTALEEDRHVSTAPAASDARAR